MMRENTREETRGRTRLIYFKHIKDDERKYERRDEADLV